MSDLVSVIIPTYKGTEKLPRAINSIVNQTYKSIEIIVVDDNEPSSVDRKQTEIVMSNYEHIKNIKYIRHKINKNGAAARNTGVLHSKGNFICFLDDDDFYLPDRIKKSVEFLKDNPLYEAIYCGVILTNEYDITGIIKAEKELCQKDILLNENSIGTGSNLFMTRKALDKLAGFDENFRRHQDLEFMLRFLSNFKMINLNEELIVKAKNGIDNIPEYNGLLKVKHLYFKKFEKEINQLEETEKQTFYCYQYGTLLNAATKSKNKENIIEAKYNIGKFRKLTLKERVLIFLTVHQLLNGKLYNILKQMYNSLYRNENYKYNVSDDIKKFIRNQL